MAHPTNGMEGPSPQGSEPLFAGAYQASFSDASPAPGPTFFQAEDSPAASYRGAPPGLRLPVPPAGQAAQDPSVQDLLRVLAESQASSQRALADAQANAQRQTDVLLQQMAQQQAQFIALMSANNANAAASAAAAAPAPTPGPRRRGMVDNRGIARPPTLDAKTAHKPSLFKTWRIKCTAWIISQYPECAGTLAQIEKDTAAVFDTATVEYLSLEIPDIEEMSANLWALLVSICVEEPFDVIERGPRGPEAGLEALRRLYAQCNPTGPQTAATTLNNIVSVKPVPVNKLRAAIETLEIWFSDYLAPTGQYLHGVQKRVYLQALLGGELKRHVDLNEKTWPTYIALRKEV